MFKLPTIIQLLRCQQWVKSLFVLLPFVFNPQYDTNTLTKLFLTVAGFSLLSSALYIFNDIYDRSLDSQHPTKRYRPIASGKINIFVAIVIAALLFLSSLYLMAIVSNSNLFLANLYILLVVAYTILLKKIQLIDVLILGIGFVLRALSGSIGVDIIIHNDLIIFIYICSLFLLWIKRYGEIMLQASKNQLNKLSCQSDQIIYEADFIKKLIYIFAGLIIFSFSICLLNKSLYSLLSFPILLYAIFRLLYLMGNGWGHAITEHIIYDKKLSICILLFFSVLLLSD